MILSCLDFSSLINPNHNAFSIRTVGQTSAEHGRVGRNFRSLWLLSHMIVCSQERTTNGYEVGSMTAGAR